MTPQRNSKDCFFKYYSPSAVEAVLRSASLKWSNPSEFNDPFDNQFHLDVDTDIDRFARELADNFVDRITGSAPIAGTSRTSQALAWMRANLKQPITPEHRQQIYERTFVALAGAVERPARPSDRVRDQLKDISVFCVSEKHDDILMWAHYALNHTGAVLKLLCIKDSPLTLGQKVIYSDSFPVLRASDLFDLEALTEKVFTLITLTKSSHWQYEQEWRVVSTARDKTKPTEFLPFNRREVGAIYLGCRINDVDKGRLLELVRRDYPWTEIYQAAKNEKQFSLDFALLTV